MEKFPLIKTLTAALIALAIVPALGAECFGPDSIQKAVDTYHQNELRFVRDYKGKQIAFSWSFEKADTYSSGRADLDFGNGDRRVQCKSVNREIQDLVVEWNKGQWASVERTIDDAGFYTLYLTNCTIKAAQKP